MEEFDAGPGVKDNLVDTSVWEALRADGRARRLQTYFRSEIDRLVPLLLENETGKDIRKAEEQFGRPLTYQETYRIRTAALNKKFNDTEHATVKAHLLTICETDRARGEIGEMVSSSEQGYGNVQDVAKEDMETAEGDRQYLIGAARERVSEVGAKQKRLTDVVMRGASTTKETSKEVGDAYRGVLKLEIALLTGGKSALEEGCEVKVTMKEIETAKKELVKQWLADDLGACPSIRTKFLC